MGGTGRWIRPVSSAGPIGLWSNSATVAPAVGGASVLLAIGVLGALLVGNYFYESEIIARGIRRAGYSPRR